MGRSQPAVSDLERLGGDPHLSTIRRYALAIGVDVFHSVSVPGEVSQTSSTPAKIQVCGWEPERPQASGTASISLRAATPRWEDSSSSRTPATPTRRPGRSTSSGRAGR
ncbi:hypothetical protein ABZW49_12395 [Nonomuraea wenchangensis]